MDPNFQTLESWKAQSMRPESEYLTNMGIKISYSIANFTYSPQIIVLKQEPVLWLMPKNQQLSLLKDRKTTKNSQK